MAFLAMVTALHHLPIPPDLNLLRAFKDCFLETILPLLDFLRSFLVSPPAVLSLVPFQTCHFLPTLETFLAFLFLVAFFLGAFLAAFLVVLDLDLFLEAVFLVAFLVAFLLAIVDWVCGAH